MNSVCFTGLVITCTAVSMQPKQTVGNCTFSFFFTLSEARKMFVFERETAGFILMCSCFG